jgi:transposase InsO family protein
MHRSDQGSPTQAPRCKKLLSGHGITCSISRSGNLWDNALMQRFFPSLKTQRTACKNDRLGHEARADAFRHNQRFCNPKRRQLIVIISDLQGFEEDLSGLDCDITHKHYEPPKGRHSSDLSGDEPALLWPVPAARHNQTHAQNTV